MCLGCLEKVPNISILPSGGENDHLYTMVYFAKNLAKKRIQECTASQWIP